MPASLDRFASAKLDSLENRNLRRTLRESARTQGARVRRKGRDLVSFSCNDYLGLSHHPRVMAAAKAAIEAHGAGAGASRLVTGNHPLFAALEARLAALKQSEDAVVFGSGYLANLGTIPALVGPEDAICVDALAHNCIHAGAAASRAPVSVFRHNDLEHLRALLAEIRPRVRHALVVTDGVFSMDGDVAPVPELLALCAEYEAWLMTDDAHGVGVLGGGRGSAFAFDPPAQVPLQMGTLSKALGSLGGYVCASHIVCELLRNRARTLVYATGLPPSAAAAALAALDVIAQEPERVARPLAHAARFCARLGLPAARSPIVPVIFGTAAAALAASAQLEAEGLLVTAIRPPTVPGGTARLRFAFAADHEAGDIDRAAALVADLLKGADLS